MDDTTYWIMMGLLIVLILLPPKYDPAVRLKEWQTRRSENRR